MSIEYGSRTRPTAPPRHEADAALRRRFTEAAARPDAPTWMGHLVGGSLDYETGRPGEPTVTARLEEHRRMARMLGPVVTDVEGELVVARTGRLLRVVLDTGSEAAYCFSTVPGEQIVAFAVAGPDGAPAPEVAAVDRGLIDLVEAARRDLGLLSQNPGGLAERRSTAPAEQVPPPGGVRPHRRGDPSPAEPAEALLGPRGLHWVAGVRHGGLSFSVDVFDDQNLERFFRRIEPDERREVYTAFARGASGFVRRFNRLLRTTLSYPLRRLVLDVEQGAIMIQRRSPADHLVGVTLRQDDVEAAEAAMRDLAEIVPPLR